MKRVVVGVPTFRRPDGLRRLLISISHLEGPAPLILIADNDPVHGDGHRVVEEMVTSGFASDLHVIGVEDRGLASVRNALMNEAFERLGADYLAMVDDDQTVDTEWLCRLVAMQNSTGADLVGAHVVPRFETAPPKWALKMPIYWRAPMRAGLAEMLNGTGGLLMSRSINDRFKARFNSAFSLTGGEDKELFVRLRSQGAIFAAAPDAITWEWVDRSRTSRKWAVRRAYRIGNCETRILRFHGASANRWIRELTVIAGGLFVAPLLMLAGIADSAISMRGASMAARQLGKLAGILDRSVIAYGGSAAMGTA